MKKILLVTLLLGIAKITAQENRVITTGVPFLTIAADARASGMADIGVATSVDAFSQQWNPAKFAFAEHKMGIGISYTPYLESIITDIALLNANYYNKINDRSAFAASLRYFTLGEIELRQTAGEEGRIFAGIPYPEYQGSFSLNVRFLKNFNLYALLDYQLGLSIFNNTLLFANNFGNGAEYETLQGLLEGTPGVGSSFYNNNADPSDDITPLTPGTPEYIAAANRYATLNTNSDFGYVSKADFARLREVSISYNFNDLINSSPLSQYVKSASISFSGTNLWLSSKYSGVDPEVNFAGARSSSRGQDFLTLPQARSFFATFNIGF